jgi:hypothetical protein
MIKLQMIWGANTLKFRSRSGPHFFSVSRSRCHNRCWSVSGGKIFSPSFGLRSVF